MKMVDKYSLYNQDEERISRLKKNDLVTNQDRAAQTEVKQIVNTYGMDSLTTKWEAAEPFYCDMQEAVTLENALKLKEEANEYFANMPARARKVFGDNPDIFYQKFMQGEFEDFIKTGALNEELELHYISKLNRRKEQEIDRTRKIQNNIENSNKTNSNANNINNTTVPDSQKSV